MVACQVSFLLFVPVYFSSVSDSYFYPFSRLCLPFCISFPSVSYIIPIILDSPDTGRAINSLPVGAARSAAPTPEFSGASGLAPCARAGGYIADGQRPAICNVIDSSSCPLQRNVRQRGVVTIPLCCLWTPTPRPHKSIPFGAPRRQLQLGTRHPEEPPRTPARRNTSCRQL